ncbi:hypothetical protein IFT36_02795 [Frigoribacterium sp. CFBP 13605]|uniref:hypothetical protein n=1 Tax=Frigoribacterium sp. CFBP 13605 TaxID=2774034 RepID=UPI0019047084|nr:hypothetical protein [Frigoribacterium sp. CFBP 13605]MBD8139470.1 hypothetical protein [Frigoribacterium sp. CFBP 13605]
MSQQGAVVFEFDEVLFDEFPKAPWVPRNQRIVVDSDRRVVGRRDGIVVSVTDLPPVYAHADIGPRISSMQSFVTVGDHVSWIVRTVEGTRFTSSADGLDEEARLEIARDATLHGFLDDLECMVITDLSEMRFGQDRELTRCRLEVTRASVGSGRLGARRRGHGAPDRVGHGRGRGVRRPAAQRHRDRRRPARPRGRAAAVRRLGPISP